MFIDKLPNKHLMIENLREIQAVFLEKYVRTLKTSKLISFSGHQVSDPDNMNEDTETERFYVRSSFCWYFYGGEPYGNLAWQWVRTGETSTKKNLHMSRRKGLWMHGPKPTTTKLNHLQEGSELSSIVILIREIQPLTLDGFEFQDREKMFIIHRWPSPLPSNPVQITKAKKMMEKRRNTN